MHLNLKISHKLLFSIYHCEDLHDIVPAGYVTFTKVTEDNINHVLDFREIRHLNDFKQFLREDQLGIYAWVDSKVVGHGWAKVCKKRHCILNGYMDIFQGDSLIHYCNVSENYRSKNIYSSMLLLLCKMLFADGKTKRILIDTDINNIASCRGIRKVGFNHIGSPIYIQLNGRLLFKSKKFKH